MSIDITTFEIYLETTVYWWLVSRKRLNLGIHQCSSESIAASFFWIVIEFADLPWSSCCGFVFWSNVFFLKVATHNDAADTPYLLSTFGSVRRCSSEVSKAARRCKCRPTNRVTGMWDCATNSHSDYHSLWTDATCQFCPKATGDVTATTGGG